MRTLTTIFLAAVTALVGTTTAEENQHHQHQSRQLAVADDLPTTSYLRGGAAAVAGGGGNEILRHLQQKDGSQKQQQPNFYQTFYLKGDPSKIRDLGNDRIMMEITPWQQDVGATSNAQYTGGKLDFRVKSAAVMPGIITAVYFSSGGGRTGDVNNAKQDEIDFEFKGNEPSKVQSNVFLDGKEQLEMLDLGFDSSADSHLYAIAWNEQVVRFYVDGQLRREVALTRPLQPMQLHLSVWTTTGGWPGVIQWGGRTNWGVRGNQPAQAVIEILSYPGDGKDNSMETGED